MNLYTVTIDFADHTTAPMQLEANDHVDALTQALRKSEALEEYDKYALNETILNFLECIHLAMQYKGVWTWHHHNFENESVKDIYGGIIVQTDKNGPIRDK